MSDLRFDGRVAVVTGGGRGLGREYALLLASRGAKVVVNDPGGSITGDGTDAKPAEEVVREITATGGTAVASTESVATWLWPTETKYFAKRASALKPLLTIWCRAGS